MKHDLYTYRIRLHLTETLDLRPCGHSCILTLSYDKAWCTSHVNCMVLKLAMEKPDLA